jgi:cation diffusion facilitator CzcD-associated flavoprotein CzcO
MEVPATREAPAAQPALDAVIVGAGFAGMYMLHRLRGLGFRALLLEAGTGVGGTWYWNRYPGARCDVESFEYSYQFSPELQQKWTWSERYATQPEILRYANHVADRFDLQRDIRFNQRVRSAHFDDATTILALETEDGTHVEGRQCIMATGCLSAANRPNIPGMERFRGPTYHTGHWPHEGVDFTGRRVGVIGTGSSAIQSIPIIAEQAAQLYVFQRTPNFTVPAHNAPLESERVKDVKANYPALRARAKQTTTGLAFSVNNFSAMSLDAKERERIYRERWAAGGIPFMGSFNDLLIKRESNETAAEFVRARIRETVRDPKVADLLSPKGVIGSKRLCVDTGYWETYNRPNVTLVDIRGTPIECITPAGVVVRGVEYALDSLVFATGFDAMTGALLRMDIRGACGLPLKEKWRAGPNTYLGLQSVGFPNLFMINGPGSPSVLSSMLPAIEQHVDWIADCLAYLRGKGFTRIEPQPKAEKAWGEHVQEAAAATLRPVEDSWYLGVNIPGKPRVFMPYIGGFNTYIKKCDEVVAGGYTGFSLS